MKYEYNLINITEELESSDSMYSLICLKASKLSLLLNDVRCWLDGTYLICLNIEDTLKITSGNYEAINLRFIPYFYNVNLNHNVIGLSMYNEMRERFGYPDFHLFRERTENFMGIVSLNLNEYDLIRMAFLCAVRHIDAHETDGMWSCRTRSDMISILRIAESAYLGESVSEPNEIIRYIRDNLDRPLTLDSLCERFHTNRTTLTRNIKELTGMPPIQYILEERLNQSRPDLLFTKISINELAEKYGFSDANYYIRAFKKRFGKSPLQYRTEGYSERIRNENLYHQREAELMSVDKSLQK